MKFTYATTTKLRAYGITRISDNVLVASYETRKAAEDKLSFWGPEYAVSKRVSPGEYVLSNLSNCHYNAKEDVLILAKTMPDKELAKLMNRSVSSIYAHRYKLKKRNRSK